jgi:outer membrane protein assembly factor BamB
MQTKIYATAIAALLICSTINENSIHAENWPNWRGPTSNGVAQGKDYPVEWSSSKNIAWKVKLPGGSGSTPAVWEDRIFVTRPADGKNALLCLDRKSGSTLWEKKIGTERKGKHKKGSGSNPSPTTDGSHVYVYYKSGDLACLDFKGNIVWQHNLQKMYGEDTLWWDLGTSPVLTSKYIIVACMQSGPSYVAAFDKATGKLAWKVPRILEAPEEAAQSYSTPIVVGEDGKEVLIVLGADHVTAHSATDGKEQWRVGGLNPTGHKYFRSIASPVVTDEMVFAPYARGATLTAIRRGGSGDVTKSHVAWVMRGNSPDVPTPTTANGRVYVLSDKGIVTCLDQKKGQEIWQGNLPKHRDKYSSSPVLADGRLYVTREDGTTFVLSAGDKFELLAENKLGEFTLATPVFNNGQVLLRSFEHLYCVGK